MGKLLEVAKNQCMDWVLTASEAPIVLLFIFAELIF